MRVVSFVFLALVGAGSLFAQGTVTGTVTDPSGAAVAGASVEMSDKVTGYDKTTATDQTGAFRFLGVPQNTYHTVVAAAGLNAVIAHSAPGIIEDSNGFIHPQGDHAQTQFVFDNQPITDQQSKQFSTSMPENAVASVEVITGAPPAEYGDKTSLVINAITKSGLGVGEFASANVVRSGRCLDPPEFSALHDVGNNQTVFNRLDYQPHANDSLYLNLFFARSWFQTPSTYDPQTAGQDQRERVLSHNVAPGSESADHGPDRPAWRNGSRAFRNDGTYW